MPPEKISKLCTDYFYVYFKNVLYKAGTIFKT